jgi:hypothetical protein
MAKWPDVVTEEFWSFAVQHACTFHNASICNDTQQSPHRMFTGEEAPWKMEHFCVFGSPVIVLAKKLQDGDALQKWKFRSWLGVYVGRSLQHAGNIPVVYNPATTHISPQFHVVHEDQFTTVASTSRSFPDDFYNELFHTAKWHHTDAYAETSDLHLFEATWCDSSLPASQQKTYFVKSKSNKRRDQNISHPAKPVPSSHPAPSHTAPSQPAANTSITYSLSHPASNPTNGQPATHMSPLLHTHTPHSDCLDPDETSLTYTQNDLAQDPSVILYSTLGKSTHSDLTLMDHLG